MAEGAAVESLEGGGAVVVSGRSEAGGGKEASTSDGGNGASSFEEGGGALSCGAGAEELSRKLRREKLVAGASGTVKYQDGVGDVAAGVPCGRAEGGVVQTQLWEGLAGAEAEIMGNVVALR